MRTSVLLTSVIVLSFFLVDLIPPSFAVGSYFYGGTRFNEIAEFAGRQTGGSPGESRLSGQPNSGSPPPSLGGGSDDENRYVIHNTVQGPYIDGVDLTTPLDGWQGRSRLLDKGYVDASAPPFLADSTGTRDATAAINKALRFARDNQLVTYLPKGIYRVSDTLECAQEYYERSTGRVLPARLFPCTLVGEKSARGSTVILLPKDTPGFAGDNGNKPLIRFWTRAVGLDRKVEPDRHSAALSMNQFIENVEIRIEAGNKGAIGLWFWGAQGTALEGLKIDAGDAFAGIWGSAGSGGINNGIEILGGRYGWIMEKTQPVTTVVDLRMSGQKDSALLYKGRQTLVLVGVKVRFEGSGPIIQGTLFNRRPFNGQISIVDSEFDVQANGASRALIETKSAFTIHNTSMRNVVMGETEFSNLPDKWYFVKDFARSQGAVKFEGNAYLMPLYMDGIKSRATYYVNEPVEELLAPRSVSNHGLTRLSTSDVLADFADVTEAPYFAKGDGITDDTAAIQQALREHDSVFLPKGYYKIKQPIVLRNGQKLYGAAPHLSTLVLAENHDLRMGEALVKCDPGAGVRLERFGIQLSYSQVDTVALNCPASAESVVNRVLVLVRPARGFKDPDLKQASQRVSPLVVINGGGRWYGLHQEHYGKHSDDYAHLAVRDSTQSPVFYGLNMEHSTGRANVTLQNTDGAVIFGAKFEGNVPGIFAENVSNLRLFGLGGNASVPPDIALIMFRNVDEYVLTNLVTQPRGGVSKQQTGFAGRAYDGAGWSVFSATKGIEDRSKMETKPLERPVLVMGSR